MKRDSRELIFLVKEAVDYFELGGVEKSLSTTNLVDGIIVIDGIIEEGQSTWECDPNGSLLG